MDNAIKFCYILSYFLAMVMGQNISECTESSKVPQLSTTFLNGQWYEYFYVNEALNDQTCSYYDITCKNDSLSCDVAHLIWKGYNLSEIWHGTITENDTGITLSIQRTNLLNVYNNVQFKYEDDYVLTWVCNETAENGIEFASVLKRIDQNAELDSVWQSAVKDTNYPTLLEDFPAGIWHKINAKECIRNKAPILQKCYTNILAIALFFFTLQMYI